MKLVRIKQGLDALVLAQWPKFFDRKRYEICGKGLSDFHILWIVLWGKLMLKFLSLIFIRGYVLNQKAELHIVTILLCKKPTFSYVILRIMICCLNISLNKEPSEIPGQHFQDDIPSRLVVFERFRLIVVFSRGLLLFRQWNLLTWKFSDLVCLLT